MLFSMDDTILTVWIRCASLELSLESFAMDPDQSGWVGAGVWYI